MPKIVYIASLSHSGSTLLAMLLGAHPKVVCLGEVYPSVLKGAGQYSQCTCGKESEDCDVWGSIVKDVNASDEKEYAEHYNKIITAVGEEYGDDCIIVDSSKKMPALQSMLAGGISDISVLFSVKDVRSFVHSQMKRRMRPVLMKKDGWRRIYTTSILYNVIRWVAGNYRTAAFISRHKLRCYRFGYEELCFQPERTMRNICQFIGVDYNSDLLTPEKSKSHMIRGNRMRFAPGKLKGIKYDYSWMSCKRLVVSAWVYSLFMGMNNRYVYSNDDTLDLQKEA